MNELFEQCLKAATVVVAEEKNLYPGCEGATNFDVSGGSSQTNTAFDRHGTSRLNKQYSLPSDLGTSLTNLYANSAVPAALSTAETNYLTSVLTRNQSAMPGAANMESLIGLDATDHTGRSALSSIIAQNPYSNNYEQATQDLYERSFDVARSRAQSGPDNVRGGTARQGFELGELGSALSRNRFKDVKDQQTKDAGVVAEATQIANAIEASRRGTSIAATQQRNAGELARGQQGLEASGRVGAGRNVNLGNLALASEILGQPQQTQTDDLTGQGNQIQGQSSFSTGLSCCFIFLEVLNGQLPWFVRLARDTFCTTKRRSGYNWMAKWLVPKMQRSAWLKHLVNLVMVKPCIVYGEWHFTRDKQFGWALRPYVQCWFWLWDLCGLISKKV